ncbi:MAG: hypothetical protein Q9165_003218 [Trypethelium subeluteriae]
MPSASASRPATRKSSRTSSPALRSSLDATPSLNGVQKEQGSKQRGRFVEPPLLPPQPSWKDDNLNPLGVLSQMQPLGTMPPKAKGKAKMDLDQSSSAGQAMDYTMTAEAETPETTPPVESRRSESRRSERKSTKRVLTHDDEDETGYEHIFNTSSNRSSRVTRSMSIEDRLSRVPLDGQSGESTRALGAIIEKCADKAKTTGNPSIATALYNMLLASNTNPSITTVLVNVMAQKPSASDAATFQEFIKSAKKEGSQEPKAAGSPNKKRRIDVDVTTAPSSGRAHAQSGKTIISLHANRARESNDTAETSYTTPTTDATTPPDHSLLNANAAKMNGGSSLSEPPERAGSSPLSSTHSDDVDVTDVFSGVTDAALAAPAAGTRAKNARTPQKKTTQNNKSAAKSNQRKAAAPPPPPPPPPVSQEEDDRVDEERAAKKRKLEKKFENGFTESHVRQPLVENWSGATDASGQDSARPASNQSGKRKMTHSGSNGLSGKISLPSSTRGSRHATPRAPARPVRKSKSARIKMSPEKKKIGTTAGIGRVVGGGRESPVRNDEHDGSSSDNDDECTACGGNGLLLCCDGCNRAFHFSCLDPPKQDDDPMFDAPWFCSSCETMRAAPPNPPRGLFADLTTNVQRRNTKSFFLPLEVRDTFEGVQTGEDGEFENVVRRRKVEVNRSGWEMAPDYTRLTNKQGKFIICWRCNKSALGNRPIITCDVPGCGLHWHLDCLDPPRANPPAPSDTSAWRCPAHVEHDLAIIPAAMLVPEEFNRRILNYRRPKNATVVDTASRRDDINNGLIDVEMSDSDGDSFYEEEALSGVVHRLPEHGIKLDFIDKVKQSWGRPKPAYKPVYKPTVAPVQKAPVQVAPCAPPVVAQPGQPQFASDARKRSFDEVKTALNMLQMSGSTAGLSDLSNDTNNLIAALIAEAPPDVVARMSERESTNLAVSETVSTGRAPHSPAPSNKVDLGSLSDAQKISLKALRELIDKALQPEEANIE